MEIGYWFMVYTLSHVHECCAILTFHRSTNLQILVWNNHWDFWCGLGLVLGFVVGLGNLVREHEMTYHYLAICIINLVRLGDRHMLSIWSDWAIGIGYQFGSTWRSVLVINLVFLGLVLGLENFPGIHKLVSISVTRTCHSLT